MAGIDFGRRKAIGQELLFDKGQLAAAADDTEVIRLDDQHLALDIVVSDMAAGHDADVVVRGNINAVRKLLIVCLINGRCLRE